MSRRPTAATPPAQDPQNQPRRGGGEQQQRQPAFPQHSFICPSTQAANAPEAVREETLRRMELHVLHVLLNMAPMSTQTSPPEEATKGTHRHHFPSPEVSSSSSLSRSWDLCPYRSHHALKQLRDECLVLELLMRNLREQPLPHHHHSSKRRGDASDGCRGHRAMVLTQRDVYYHLVREVPDQGHVNAAIQRLVGWLRVPREALGVTAGARGSIGGALRFRGMDLMPAVRRDGHGGCDGLSLPVLEADCGVQPWRPDALTTEESVANDNDDRHASSHAFTLHPNVRFILVIEKHAAFHRLMQEGLPWRLPCVLLTAHGFPTHAARRLLYNLHQAAPQLPVVALVDYNPSGLAILLQYKLGARARGGTPRAARSEEMHTPFSSSSSLSCKETSSIAQRGAPASRSEVPCLTSGRWKGMLENQYSRVPAVRWLGLRSTHMGLCHTVQEVAAIDKRKRRTIHASSGPAATPSHVPLPDGLPHQPFTGRDAALMRNLVADLERQSTTGSATSGETTAWAPSTLAGQHLSDDWLREARGMAAAGVKVELEAMYTRGTMWGEGATPHHPVHLGQGPRTDSRNVRKGVGVGFAEWVCERLLKHDYI